MVAKGYWLGIMASQWKSELEQKCEEHNQQHHAPGYDDSPEHSDNYLNYDRDRAVVTVEFEVPDEVFKRQPTVQVAGVVVKEEPCKK